MLKRLLAALLSLACLISLGGCWNYTSLDQLAIVVGIAIDFDKKDKLYNLCYEVADLASAERRSTVSGKLTYSQGKNLFDTARNAKRREDDRLFFGGAHVLILSQELARSQGVLSSLEWFLRDSECRENMCVAMSLEESAAAILESQKEKKGIVTITLHDILREDQDVTGTSLNTPLYQLYNELYSQRKSAVLPALGKVKNGEKEVVEVNGLAVIKEDRLAGFLSPEQGRYLLMAENELHGGIITVSMTDIPADDISLEIFKSRAKKSFTYEQGKLTVFIETVTNVSIAENRGSLDTTKRQVVSQIEERAALKLEEGLSEMVSALQQQYGADVLGFGEMIYKRDLKLWRQLEPQWDELYPSVEIKVSSKVNVSHASSTR